MNALTLRQKLITYLADAEDSKVNALYTLLENDIQEEQTFALSPEQLDFLEEEHNKHINGQSKSYTRREATEIILGKRAG